MAGSEPPLNTQPGALLVPQQAVIDLQGHASARRRRYRQQGDDSNREGRRNRRQSVDRSRRHQAGRARHRRGLAEGSSGDAGRSEAVSKRGDDDHVKILHQPSDRSDGHRHSHGDHRRGHDARSARRPVPRDCAARSPDLRHLRWRRCPDHRAIGRHSHRAADERRGQHELHVLAQRHRQRADAVDRQFRRCHRPEYGPDSGAKPRNAGRVAAPRGRQQLRRHRTEIGARAADADRPVLAQGHLRCAGFWPTTPTST